MSDFDNQEIANELDTKQPVEPVVPRRITSADVDVTVDVAAIFEDADLTEEVQRRNWLAYWRS